MPPHADLAALEAAFHHAGFALGATRHGCYETAGTDPDSLWLLVISQTIRMPFDGAVMVPAGAVILRRGEHDVLFDAIPPSQTGGGWEARVETELWVTLDPRRPERGARLHRQNIAPRLVKAGLTCMGEEADAEGHRSTWTADGRSAEDLVVLAVRLADVPLTWEVE